MSTTAAQTTALTDRLDIQELAAQYAIRCDTRDYDRVGELFAEDGVWNETVIGFPLCEGREAIHALFSSMAQADLEFIIHINGSHSITPIDDNHATGTVHLHAAGRFNNQTINIYGYYADQYVKTDCHWLLAHRKLIEIAPSTGFGT